MDLGVGAFVFSSGVVSGRAYAHHGAAPNLLSNFAKSLRSSLPLLTLGFIRLLATKSVNYQEHNSEYGLHWNFFFTLGFLPPFTAIAASLSTYIPFSVLGLSTAIGKYQLKSCLLLNEGWLSDIGHSIPSDAGSRVTELGVGCAAR